MSSKNFRGNERTRMQRRPAAQAVDSADTPQHPLLQLQRQIGNAQVARMLQRQASEAVQRDDEANEEEIQELRDTQLQRQEDEEEIQASRDSDLQRQEDEEEIQASHDGSGLEVGMEGGPVSAETSQSINSARGGGSPLSSGMLNRMQEGFGADLSDVRVHSGTESESLNRKIGAKAFTTGSDVFLGKGSSPDDSNLMAHELTHVVQQRSMAGGGPMRVTAAGDQHEQEADRAASIISSGGTIAPKRDQQAD